MYYCVTYCFHFARFQHFSRLATCRSLDNSFTKMGTGSNDDGGGDRSVPLKESKEHWEALSKYFNR